MDVGFTSLAVVESEPSGVEEDTDTTELYLWGSHFIDNLPGQRISKVYRLDHPTATTFNGQLITADLEIETIFMGDPGRLTRWTWLESVFEQNGTATVDMTVTLDGDTGSTIQATATLALSGHDRVEEYMSINQRARDISVKWTSKNLGERPKLLAAVIEGKPTVSRRR